MTDDSELNEMMAVSAGGSDKRYSVKAGRNLIEDSSIAEPKDNRLANVVQWTTDDNRRFIPAAKTCGNLPPGLYEIRQANGIGMYFENIPVKTEGLLRFPQANSDRVVNEIQKFWTREDLFKKFKLVHKRGILLWGPPGCLAEGTKIQCRSRVPHKKEIGRGKIAIDRLYQLFHGITGPGKGRYQKPHPEKVYYVASVDKEGRVLTNTIVDVVKSGKKECFRLTTKKGHVIEATKDHRFLTNLDEYAPLEKLSVGDFVYIHGKNLINTSKKNTTRKPRKDVEGLKFLTKEQNVHHIDEDHSNDNQANLMIISRADHAKLHMDNAGGRNLYFVVEPDEIVSIVSVGEKETYDIEMQSPNNNFIASNIVVHNSGKSSTIQLLMKDVVGRGGVAINFCHPGLFLEGMRLLRSIQKDTPVIILMEDIDEILRQYQESQVLNILDGVELLDKTVFLATTNYPEVLGPRIVNRPSRFDKRFKIGHPNSESRKIYLEHLLREHQEIRRQHNLEKWVKDTEGFSLAHLKELFVAVVILEDEYSKVVETLKSMREKISSDFDEGRLGFSPSRGDDYETGGRNYR